MVVNTEFIEHLFEQLITEKITRKYAQSEVYKLYKEEENCTLQYEPVQEESKIWDAITFIDLFAEKIAPNEYLYEDFDLQIFMQENGWH